MQVVLVMFRPDGQRRSFAVARDVTVMGRREDSDFRIPLSDVSRKHCRLIVDPDSNTVRVEDLGSANGTFVNGNKVQESEVNAGDTLAVGPVTFVVQIDGTPAEEDMNPVLPVAAGAGAADDVLPSADDAAELSPDQLEAADDDEIARILNDENGGSSIPGALPGANSDSLGDALLDLDSDESQKNK